MESWAPAGPPKVELWSCSTAGRFPDEPAAVQELAVRQWRTPVRFRETIRGMYDAGVRVFIEVGPRGNLSAFVSDTLGKASHAAPWRGRWSGRGSPTSI